MKWRGLFVVIDGSDGTGKKTQTRLIVSRLKKDGFKVRMEDFPQYGKKSAGPIEDYLSGKYGSANKLGAYIPSILFAIDRFTAAERIKNFLKKGHIVLANRYVTSNMAHQGGKIKNTRERNDYFKWLLELEYTFFRIPKPDLNIILHLPPEISIKLIKKRGIRDIHEKDLKHLKAAEKVYLQIAKKYKFPVIKGFINHRLLSPKEINDKIYAVIRG